MQRDTGREMARDHWRPTYADTILDRLVHNAHRIDLRGESLRRSRPKITQKG